MIVIEQKTFNNQLMFVSCGKNRMQKYLCNLNAIKIIRNC